MAKINTKHFAQCSVTVPLTFEGEDGARVSDNFVVNYRSYSTSILQDLEKLAADGSGRVPYAKSLPLLIISIPDVVDDDGAPAKITEDLLNTWSVKNLERIFDAIVNDESPPTPSPEPGQGG